MNHWLYYPVFWLIACISTSAYSQTAINIAVASNFASTLKEISARYQATHKNSPKIRLIVGSSGKHFAQIFNGAPYDLFFSADAQKPQALVNRGVIAENHVMTYAIGRIVLWSNYQNSSSSNFANQLKNQPSKHTKILTIANPSLAPYGLASKQALEKMGLWNDYQKRIVLGENINQTFHFVNSQALRYGFIAYSQWLNLPSAQKATQQYWLVPEEYHQPITQKLALIKNTHQNQKLIQYIQTPNIQKLIQKHGYQTNSKKQ